MLINQKNISTDSLKLQQDNYLRISNFLESGFSNQIYKCLSSEVKWGLACHLNGESKTFLNYSDVNQLSLKEQESLEAQLNLPFQFIYNTYMIVTSYLEQRDPGHFLYTILEWLNSVETLQYFRTLIRDDSLIKINAQATRYLPGHFLKQHNDENLEEGRLYAYVLGFSKDWNPDWGGLLNVLNENGEIVKTLIPEYNSLSIFKVPQNHFVSYVSPFAESERLAITGWLLAK
jgi:Rps23 Pro-64 3,4-dihydroxylase Tpa1-like proline 4-hydroxylase